MAALINTQDDEWDLFCDAIPIAHKAALYWNGDAPEAIEARRKISKAEGGRDSYYANLCAEFQSLVNSVDRLRGNSDFDVPKGCVTKVLDLLEKRCTPLRTRDKLSKLYKGISSNTYVQLYELILHVDATPIDQMQLVKRMRFKEKKKETRVEIIRRLTECANRLESLAPLRDGEIWASQNWKKKNVRQLYSKNRHSLATRLHQLLTKHWTCKCKPHSNVHLLMDPVGQLSVHKNILFDPTRTAPSQLDGQFSIWFSVRGEDDTRVTWQESIILVYKDEWLEETEIDYQAHSQTVNSKGKSARFATEKSPSYGPWNLEQGGICKAIQDLTSRSTRSLHLVVKENDLKHWTPQSAYRKFTEPKFWSLQEITQNQPSILSSQKSGVRYVIAFLVASSFLQMSGSPWLASWIQKQPISFLGTTSGFSSGTIEPFLSTKLGENVFTEDSNKKSRLHPYPEILALGILLLEIWLGKSIKDDSVKKNMESKVSKDDIDAYISVADKMLQDDCRVDSLPDFDDAIKACIDPLRFNAGHSLEEDNFREEVYKAVVGPIEHIVTKGYRVNIENKAELRSFLGVNSSLPAPIAVNSSAGYENSKSGRDFKVTNQWSNTGFAGTTGERLLAQDAKIAGLTDDWMKIMEGHIHILLSNDINGNHSLFKNNILRSDETDDRPRPVRIAILDTGINLPKSARLKFANRIKGYKDWVGTSDERDKWVDTDGHGTHAGALLLRVAPHAEIYVARVFIGKNNEGENEISSGTLNKSITEAIYHAVDTWRVDIISMSFGFGKSPASIDQAILHAHSKSVIMFAAVGNSGGNSPVHFPARSSNVIAINATDGLGNQAPFTANLRSDDSNFALPGIDVESSWPMDLGKGLKIRASGTSCATPIAAAVAANILEIAGLQLEKAKGAGQTSQDEEDDWKKLSTRGGMRTAFRLMSTKRLGSFGYDNVQPWNFFPPGPAGYSKIESAMDALLRGLRNEN